VLVIEDNPSDQYIYRRYFEMHEQAEFTVLEASSAEEGLTLCADEAPDCILLDYRLPDGDGLSLLPRLRKLTAAPIIFITARPEALTVTEAYRQGASRYFSKDFISSRTLVHAVCETVEDHRAATRGSS
jgi:CheY-like chemotaxis protein